MIDFIQTYFDDAYVFLPKDIVSSPMSQSVRDKVFEVMTKTLSFSPSLCGSKKLTLRILSKELFSLGLLSEVIEDLNLDYTYYKWVKVGDDFELTLYKNKPKEEYIRYLLQVFAFVLGYMSLPIFAFTVSGLAFYGLFDFLKANLPRPNHPMIPPLSYIFYVFLTFLLSVVISLGSLDLYVVWFKGTAWGKKLENLLYFGTLDSIDKPSIL
jgi:hypothetical protein